MSQNPKDPKSSEIKIEKVNEESWITDLQLDSSWLVAGMTDGGTGDSGTSSGSGSGGDDDSSSGSSGGGK